MRCHFCNKSIPLGEGLIITVWVSCFECFIQYLKDKKTKEVTKNA